MKKWAILALGIAALASIAATCRITNISLTEVDDDMHFGAEMVNETEADILNHRYRVAFTDNSNGIAANVVVDGCLRSLQSGASDYFSADSNKSDSQVKAALARLEGPLTFGQVVNGDLVISNVSAVRNGETLVVTGTVTNDDNDDLEDARVCIVVLNDSGNVVVVQRDNDNYDLDAGAAANFSVTLTVPNDVDDVEHVHVLVDATNTDEDDRVTEPQSRENVNVHTATPTVTGTPPTSTPTATATATHTATPTATPTP